MKLGDLAGLLMNKAADEGPVAPPKVEVYTIWSCDRCKGRFRGPGVCPRCNPDPGPEPAA